MPHAPFPPGPPPRILVFAFLMVLGSGCLGGGESPDESPAPATSPMPAFRPGVYYAQPGSQGASLARLDGTPAGDITFGGVGFDLANDLFVATQGASSLRLVRPNGVQDMVALDGVIQVARPTLSSDGKRVVVQGVLADGGAGDIDVFMIDLATREVTRVSRQPVNEESPEWVPGHPWVVWSSFDPEAGIDAHVFDVQAGTPVTTLQDAGAIHLAVSSDGTRLLDPGRMRVYRLPQGDLEADLLAATLEGLSDAGYQPDTRFPGQAGRGTFPVDGDFSPDGTRIVFDGAVQREGTYGVVLAEIAVDGTGFALVSALLEVDPARSNNHNFSQLNPTWI